MKHIEHLYQSAVVEWADTHAGRYPELSRLFAVPNGAFLHGEPKQRARQMKRLRQEGLKEGVLDLWLPVPVLQRPLIAGEALGLVIEMKTETGRLSSAQRDWKQYLESTGYEVGVHHRPETAQDHLAEYMRRTHRGKY